MLKVNYIASGSVSVRRSAIEKINMFDERFWIGEDYNCWLNIALLGKAKHYNNIKYIHDILYLYRYDPLGNSLTNRKDIQEKHIDNLKIIKKEITEKLELYSIEEK